MTSADMGGGALLLTTSLLGELYLGRIIMSFKYKKHNKYEWEIHVFKRVFILLFVY